MRRRDIIRIAAGVPVAALSAQETISRKRTGVGPVKITSVEALVIRTPGDSTPPSQLVVMPPLGATTGGVGLWNRLDFASPSRTKGHTQAVLVRIRTAPGITGWGECHAPEAPSAHKALISDLFGPLLIGQDALDVEPQWERMYSTERLRGYSTGVYTEALAGIDLALWDILGQFAGLPVYRLLGGKFRDSVPTYTGIEGGSSSELKDSAVKAINEGFSVVKMGLAKGRGTSDIGRVIAVAGAIEGKGQVSVDSLGAYKLYEAVKLGRELDRIGNIGWWEDPLMPDDLEAYPKLAAAVDLPVCAGEELCNRFQFRDLLVSKSADIINPDVCRAGGITEVRRIAAMADAHGVLWAPHISTGTALYIAASAHVALSTPNLIVMEGGRSLAGPLGNRLLREPLQWKPGSITPPDRPGLGVDLQENELKRVIAG
jgi:L-alanine-DL-glutamate epimerase-like enolase superfamily enzyme